MIRDLAEAGAWLEGLLNIEKRPDWPYARFSLGPITRLLARLGHPEAGLAAVHVAGSKGKGSTALLAEALLRGAGERVGTYTSPHLERWTERVRVDGCEASGEALAAWVERVRPEVEALCRESPADAPSFFDALTAAALHGFREAGVRWAVLEVGLGGRLDSTNAVRPRVACITQIELEHTDRLGGTLAEIAAEKAGILKPGVPGVVGALPPEAARVVEARARALGAPLAWAGRDFSAEILAEDGDGLMLRLRDGPLELEAHLPLLGRHQAENAALALAALRRAGIADERLAAAAPAALARVVLPGRLERLGERPLLLVDAAHTPASARALAAVLRGLRCGRTHLVLSISAGKDARAILEALLPLADRLTLTRAEPARSLAPEEVAAVARTLAPEVELQVVPNPQLALRAAAAALAPDEALCATGSVYLAGIARRVLRELAPPGCGVTTRRAPTPDSVGGA